MNVEKNPPFFLSQNKRASETSDRFAQDSSLISRSEDQDSSELMTRSKSVWTEIAVPPVGVETKL